MSLDDLHAMTDLYSGDGRRTYDESLPPSLYEDPVVDPPPDDPPPPPPVPSTGWIKADIVTWLLDNGVALDEDALTALTKSELLDLVEDLLDDEVDES